MPTRLALYCRVSTSDQTVEPQLHALRAYASARGVEAVEYVDQGVSGAGDRRPALDRLLGDARRRRFDVLAICKLDRLARSVRHLTVLAAELEALGIGLVVLDQSIDTSTPSGRFLFHTLSAVAELERDLIAERTRAGMAAARRRGARFGPRKAIRGGDCFAVERMLAAGRSQAAVARELRVSPATISRYAAAMRKRITASAGTRQASA